MLEADQAHVVIERQPRHAAIVGADHQAMSCNRINIREHGAMRDRDALREASAAGRELQIGERIGIDVRQCALDGRSEEHTSELQSLMRISYAVFCLKKKKQ